MTFRFLHLADLHLDTAFGGTSATRERLSQAVLEAWDRALEFAAREGAHAVLIAGDAFDDADLDRAVELRFRRGIQRAAEAGLHVLYACGNHDPGGQNNRAGKLGLEGDAPWQTRVHLFRGARPRSVTVTDAAGEAVGVVVGVGHSKLGVDTDLVAKLTRQATELPVVGLVHTQVHGARRVDEHRPYAPSTRESFLPAGYDYWALGHVHVRQRVFDDLPVWYAGNLQGRNPKETGEKGGLFVELERGVPAQPRFVPFAPVVWQRVELDGLAMVDTAGAFIEHVERRVDELTREAGTKLALRLVPTGPCPLAAVLNDPRQRRVLEEELTEETAALEVQLRPEGLHRPRDLETLRATPSVISELLALHEELSSGGPIEDFAPERLAWIDGGRSLEGEARAAYLRELLAGLDETFLDRALSAPEADA